MFNLNFYTIATGRYNIFVLPYIITSLWFNKNSFAEILVDKSFKLSNDSAVFLNNYFKDRWLIRAVPNKFSSWLHSGKKIKSIRWLTKPSVASKYVYIGDIDLITLEGNVAKKHAAHATFIERPYSNIVRRKNKKKKITGLHFVLTKPYYAKLNHKRLGIIQKRIANGNWSLSKLDECLLYYLIKTYVDLPPKHVIKASSGKPWEKINYRPTHGIHISFGRKLHGWGVTKHWLQQSIVFKDTQLWKDSVSFLDSKFIEKFSDATLKKAFDEHEKEVSRRRIIRALRNEKGNELNSINCM